MNSANPGTIIATWPADISFGYFKRATIYSVRLTAKMQISLLLFPHSRQGRSLS